MRFKLVFPAHIPTRTLQTLLRQPVRKFYDFCLMSFLFSPPNLFSNCFLSYHRLKFSSFFTFSYFLWGTSPEPLAGLWRHCVPTALFCSTRYNLLWVIFMWIFVYAISTSRGQKCLRRITRYIYIFFTILPLEFCFKTWKKCIMCFLY